jgi:hypothetical protein
MTEFRAYEEFIDFIAAGPSSEHVAMFQPSETTRQRVADLVAREKDAGLSAAESEELDQYLRLEHIMRLAKARARRLLSP